MKIIPRERLRPGERRQRTTYDKDGRVLIPGTAQRQRITLTRKEDTSTFKPGESHKTPGTPASGSPATKPPTGHGMKPLATSKAGAAKDTSMLQLPLNATDSQHETTEPKAMMGSVRTKETKHLFPGMRKALHTLASASQSKQPKGA